MVFRTNRAIRRVIAFSSSLGLASLCLLPWANIASGTDCNLKGQLSDLLVRSGRELRGIEQLAPGSQALRYFSSEISNLRSWNKFPRIEPSELGTLQKLDAGGLGNSGVFKAELGSETVFIKISSTQTRTEGDVLAEARNIMLLNKVGLCPEFKGLIRLDETRYGIVTAFEDGVAFPPRPGYALPADLNLTEKMATDIESAGKLVSAVGLGYAPDMQFMLTRDGRATLIDPEYFKSKFPLEAKLDLPHEPIHNAKILAADLRREIAHRRTRPVSRDSIPRGTRGGLILPNQTEQKNDVKIIIPGQ